jgi:hypothetical protein
MSQFVTHKALWVRIRSIMSPRDIFGIIDTQTGDLIYFHPLGALLDRQFWKYLRHFGNGKSNILKKFALFDLVVLRTSNDNFRVFHRISQIR